MERDITPTWADYEQGAADGRLEQIICDGEIQGHQPSIDTPDPWRWPPTPDRTHITAGIVTVELPAEPDDS